MLKNIILHGRLIFVAGALQLNLVAVNSGALGSVSPGEEAGDPDSLLFEQKLIDLVLKGTWGSNVNVYPFTQRSFNDLVKGAVEDDYISLAAGNVLIFTYVCVMVLSTKEICQYDCQFLLDIHNKDFARTNTGCKLNQLSAPVDPKETMALPGAAPERKHQKWCNRMWKQGKHGIAS